MSDERKRPIVVEIPPGIPAAVVAASRTDLFVRLVGGAFAPTRGEEIIMRRERPLMPAPLSPALLIAGRIAVNWPHHATDLVPIVIAADYDEGTARRAMDEAHGDLWDAERIAYRLTQRCELPQPVSLDRLKATLFAAPVRFAPKPSLLREAAAVLRRALLRALGA